MKTGIMQTGLCHPERLEAGWDWFTGSDLTEEESYSLEAEGWESWSWDQILDREVWIRPTPAPEMPELVADEGRPDD